MLQVGVHFLPLLVYVETEALAKQWLEVFFDSAECDPEDVGVGGCVENDSECCVIKDYLAELSPKPSSFADYDLCEGEGEAGACGAPAAVVSVAHVRSPLAPHTTLSASMEVGACRLASGVALEGWWVARDRLAWDGCPSGLQRRAVCC